MRAFVEFTFLTGVADNVVDPLFVVFVGTMAAPATELNAGSANAPQISEAIATVRILPSLRTEERLSIVKASCLTLCRPFPTTCREPNQPSLNNVPVRKFGIAVTRIAVTGISLAVLGGCASTDTSQTSVEQSPTSVVRPIEISSSDIAFATPFSEPWPASAAQRIVTVANGSGEVVVALGGGSRIIGRDETSDAPEIANTPIVTSGHEINAESVIALNPDLVLIDASSGPQESIDALKSAGIKVVEVPEAWTITDIDPKVSAIGVAIGAPTQAVDYVSALTSGTEQLSLPSAPKVAFLYLRGTSAIYLLGGAGSGADSMISEAGGVDVGEQAQLGPFTPLSAEELIKLDPDVLLVMTKGLKSVGGIDGLLQLPGVAQTKAAKSRSVIAVDDTMLLSFGPRTGELVLALNQAFAELTTQ
jgi:iron complex transport system substrate-binding protein